MRSCNPVMESDVLAERATLTGLDPGFHSHCHRCSRFAEQLQPRARFPDSESSSAFDRPSATSTDGAGCNSGDLEPGIRPRRRRAFQPRPRIRTRRPALFLPLLLLALLGAPLPPPAAGQLYASPIATPTPAPAGPVRAELPAAAADREQSFEDGSGPANYEPNRSAEWCVG
eukprot:tig00000455_g1043.t1